MENRQVINTNRDFIYLFQVTSGNPNGDPNNDNKPRIDPDTGFVYVSDVSCKRFVRDFLHKEMRKNILVNVSGEGNKVTLEDKLRENINELFTEEHIQNVVQTLTNEQQQWFNNNRKSTLYDSIIKPSKSGEKSEEGEKTSKDDKKGLAKSVQKNFLDYYITNFVIDIRFFGSTFAVGGVQEGAITGAIQLGNTGQSLHKVHIPHYNQGIVSTMNDGNSTFGDTHTVSYALMCFDGTVNSYNANISNLTEEDLRLFRKSLWCGLKSSQTRSKGHRLPVFYLEVEYAEGIGNRGLDILLSEKLITNPTNTIRNFGDVNLDISELENFVIQKMKDGVIKSYVFYRNEHRIPSPKLSITDITKI